MTVIELAFGRPDAITAFLVFRDTGTLGEIRLGLANLGINERASCIAQASPKGYPIFVRKYLTMMSL